MLPSVAGRASDSIAFALASLRAREAGIVGVQQSAPQIGGLGALDLSHLQACIFSENVEVAPSGVTRHRGSRDTRLLRFIQLRLLAERDVDSDPE